MFNVIVPHLTFVAGREREGEREGERGREREGEGGREGGGEREGGREGEREGEIGRKWLVSECDLFTLDCSSYQMDSVYMFSLLEFLTTKPPSLP